MWAGGGTGWGGLGRGGAGQTLPAAPIAEYHYGSRSAAGRGVPRPAPRCQGSRGTPCGVRRAPRVKGDHGEAGSSSRRNTWGNSCLGGVGGVKDNDELPPTATPPLTRPLLRHHPPGATRPSAISPERGNHDDLSVKTTCGRREAQLSTQRRDTWSAATPPLLKLIKYSAIKQHRGYSGAAPGVGSRRASGRASESASRDSRVGRVPCRGVGQAGVQACAGPTLRPAAAVGYLFPRLNSTSLSGEKLPLI